MRRLSWMPGALLAFIAAASGCSSTTPLGSTGFCIATSTDDPEATNAFGERQQETRGGLVRVAEEDELEEPQAFEECARGLPAWAQFVDEDGEHIWLAAGARYGAREIVPAYIFDAVGEGGRLEATSLQSWTSYRSLVLSDDDGVVLALQDQAPLSEEGLAADGLTTFLGGGTALGNPAQCGLVTERAVRFATDDGEKALSNGQVEGALIHGVEFQIANVYTFERSGSDCTDGGADRISASWVAVDASL